MSRKYEVSRQTFYSWKAKGQQALQEALAPKQPQVEAGSQLHRAVLTLLVQGHASYRGIQACLKELLGLQVSLGTISAIVQTAGQRAQGWLVQQVPVEGRVVALDEQYSSKRGEAYLNVHPDVLAEYSIRRPQTCDEHLVQIRGHLKLRPYAHEEDDPRLTDYLLARALQRDDPAVLLEEAEEWLREEGILFPAESTLHKIIAQVRPQAENQVFAAITQQLSATQTQALEELLQREQGKRGSTFAWLKEPAVKASPASIKVLITKLETVRQLQLSSINVSRLNRNRVRVLAHLGAKYHRDSLLHFSQQKRAALLVCYLQELQQELLDRLLTSFDDLIMSIFRRTESSKKTHHAWQSPDATYSYVSEGHQDCVGSGDPRCTGPSPDFRGRASSAVAGCS